MMDQRYIEYFVPLVQDFLREVEPLQHPEIQNMPEPFFPLYGRSYAASALKLVIMGQDTLWWGDLRGFMAAEKVEPGIKLREGLSLFRSHKFTEWGPRRQSFWGFAMMLLAALHGQENWEAMKQGKMVEILDSFAWGNGNAIEFYSGRHAGMKVPPEYWEAIRRAGEPLNRFRHTYETLRPNVVVVMYRGLNVARYFEGFDLETVKQDGRLTHYRLPEAGVDVFHVPHPGSMNRIEGTDEFRDTLKQLLVEHGLSPVFEEFLHSQSEGKQAVAYLHAKAPAITAGFDKYEFVSWVAEELTKRDAFMSVPTLMDLVNAKGGMTNYGTPYSGGRGSYRLVSGTYWRLQNAGEEARAHNVAVAFRRPNFEYAYSTD